MQNKNKEYQKKKRIKINNKEFILTQYADDLSVILDGSEESLNETLNKLENYAKYSGLNVNFAKTHVVWIGSKTYSTDSIKTKWKLNWGVNRFTLLGITFDTNLEKMLTLNFTDRIANIKTKINYWNRRSLTPIGRITVIKSLLLSSLNHLFISLPNPNEQLLKDLNELFFLILSGHALKESKRQLYAKNTVTVA